MLLLFDNSLNSKSLIDNIITKLNLHNPPTILAYFVRKRIKKVIRLFIKTKTMSATNKKSPKASKKKKETKMEEPKEVSKSWLAFEKYIGNGVIHDMKAVLK